MPRNVYTHEETRELADLAAAVNGPCLDYQVRVALPGEGGSDLVRSLARRSALALLVILLVVAVLLYFPAACAPWLHRPPLAHRYPLLLLLLVLVAGARGADALVRHNVGWYTAAPVPLTTARAWRKACRRRWRLWGNDNREMTLYVFNVLVTALVAVRLSAAVTARAAPEGAALLSTGALGAYFLAQPVLVSLVLDRRPLSPWELWRAFWKGLRCFFAYEQFPRPGVYSSPCGTAEVRQGRIRRCVAVVALCLVLGTNFCRPPGAAERFPDWARPPWDSLANPGPHQERAAVRSTPGAWLLAAAGRVVNEPSAAARRLLLALALSWVGPPLLVLALWFNLTARVLAVLERQFGWTDGALRDGSPEEWDRHVRCLNDLTADEVPGSMDL
jgi:hypothetical protein